MGFLTEAIQLDHDPKNSYQNFTILNPNEINLIFLWLHVAHQTQNKCLTLFLVVE